MKPRRRNLFLALSLWVTAAAGQEPAAELVICYPNAPGTTESATPVMEELGAQLTRRGAPTRATYFNEFAPAERWLKQTTPRFGILAQDVYLAWRERHQLRVLAATERSGAVSERFHLLVRADTEATRLSEWVAGRRPVIWSSHLRDARFATQVVFRGALRCGAEGDVDVVSTRQPLSALRRMLKGRTFRDQAVDAVLVDDTAWRVLGEIERYREKLRVLFSAPPIPTPVVVAFGDADAGAFREVLLGLSADSDGKRLLETLQLTAFRAPDDDALKALVATYVGDDQ